MTNLSHDGEGYQMVGRSPSPIVEPGAYQQRPTPAPNAIDDDEPDEAHPTPSAHPQEPTGPIFNSRTGSHGQPVLTRLSIHDDRLKINAQLPSARHWSNLEISPPAVTKYGPTDANGNSRLVFASYGGKIRFGSFTLIHDGPAPGMFARLYRVYHSAYSDQVATLWSHPTAASKTKILFTLENHLHYTRQAIPVGLELLAALGTVKDGISHWEISADAPEVFDVARHILNNNLSRKGGGLVSGTHTSAATNKLVRLNVGSSKSDRHLTIYSNGPGLNRRNRPYIADAAAAAGVIPPNAPLILRRLEWNIKAKEARRLRFNGKPVTLATLADPAARLKVFRTQCETGFAFYAPDGKQLIPFFDWNAITTNYARQWGIDTATPAVKFERITARKSNATYGAKQAIKKLIADSRTGDYLAKVIRPELQRMTAAVLLSAQSVKPLADTIAGAGCGLSDELTIRLITDHQQAASKAIGRALAKRVPELCARAIAAEHNVRPYVTRQVHAVRDLPTISRAADTLTPVTWDY